VRRQKNNSFANFGLQGLLAAVCKCVVLWAGFPLSLRGRTKNKINSLALHRPINEVPFLSIRFFCNFFNFLLSYHCVLSVLYTCLQRPGYMRLGVVSGQLWIYQLERMV
jgi:hypothetical protein